MSILDNARGIAQAVREIKSVIVGIWLLTLFGIALLGVVARHFRVEQHPGTGVASTDEMERFLKHLELLWQRYLEMVQLLITLLTGVIAVLAGMVRLVPHDAVANRQYFAAGFVSLLIGLTCALLWRIDAQLAMEIEIFGKPDYVKQLFTNHGVPNPFTTSFEYSSGSPVFRPFAVFCMMGTAAGLVTGLSLLSLFAYSNLPELTR